MAEKIIGGAPRIGKSIKNRFSLNYKTNCLRDNFTHKEYPVQLEVATDLLKLMNELFNETMRFGKYAEEAAEQFINYEERIGELEHELNTLDGLYASDNKEMENVFRLDFSKILKR